MNWADRFNYFPPCGDAVAKSRASPSRFSYCHFASQGLAEPRLLIYPYTSSVPLCSENATKWLAWVHFRCWKAICGTWVLMLAPLLVISMLCLWMVTYSWMGVAWPCWFSSVRLMGWWLPSRLWLSRSNSVFMSPAAVLSLLPLLLLVLFLIGCQLLSFVGYQQFTDMGLGKNVVAF